MILADTSVWVDHLRKGNSELTALLEDEQVLVHPFVVGELACGTMRNRSGILGLLRHLPEARVAEYPEVLSFIEDQRLFGRGLGWVDVHLLAAARLSGSRVFTLDKPLLRVARSLRLSA